jgi:O-antigen/teichoic acid export membrane protein
VWSALGLVSLAAGVVVLVGLVAAGPLSVALLGSSQYAGLVRLSMIGVAGYALFATLQGWFAGRSDVKAPFTLAVSGAAAAVLATLLLVPRFGLAGGVLGAALFYPVGIATALLVHRRDYSQILRTVPHPIIARKEVRAMLAIGLGSLVLALCDQGALLAARLHYVRAYGLSANGHFQAAIALSQQAGAAFYTYLAAYAFGTISGFRDVAGVRDYTRKVWLPVTLLAALGCATAVLISGPLVRLFYSSQFDPAARLVGWMLWGEFARVAMQTWALGSLPIGGLSLWLSIMLSSPLALIVAYPTLVALGAGPLSLPLAYAAAGLAAMGVAAVRMSRRGVTLAWGQALALIGALAVLGALAVWRNGR